MTSGLEAVLTGQTDEHLAPLPGTALKLHRESVEAFCELRAAAAQAGFELAIASAFRGFSAQLQIWNDKATGKRPLLDAKGRLLEAKALRPDALAEAILRWSALPGLSRHHWGTDFDVFDARVVEPGYRIELTPEESESKFGKLHAWLDGNLGRFGFFRPYSEDLGGVSPERWHLSHATVSDRLMRSHSVLVAALALDAVEFALKTYVLQELPRLFERYFLRISPSRSMG